MTQTDLANQLPQEDKKKVAYALNLCAVSISQIIDSKDMIVLKQERESILNNLNLQNFVKHPALLEVLKQILDTITYLEIQAGDMSFIEGEYQQKLKNAIWTAIPSPGALIAGGNPVSLALAVATQIGTGYMNYRRNKNEYKSERDRSEWELKRHEIEQLQGLRAQLFETAWRLSSDYDFEDKYRLTQKQLSRYSEALLEPDHLKRHERLDVMSDKFSGFPPFWYYKGNAALEVFRGKQYSFSEGYKEKALTAYNEFHKAHFEFLREDVIAASCCIEHISLLAPNDVFADKLLQQALHFAGDNYDVLQQSIFVNLQLGKTNEIIAPLREMIVNNYNVSLNGNLLSRIYFKQSNRSDYDKLLAIAGVDNVPPWSDDADKSEGLLKGEKISLLSDEFKLMIQRIITEIKTNKSSPEKQGIYKRFQNFIKSLLTYCGNSRDLSSLLTDMEEALKRTVFEPDEKRIMELFELSKQIDSAMQATVFSAQIIEDEPKLINEMRKVVPNKQEG